MVTCSVDKVLGGYVRDWNKSFHRKVILRRESSSRFVVNSVVLLTLFLLSSYSYRSVFIRDLNFSMF